MNLAQPTSISNIQLSRSITCDNTGEQNGNICNLQFVKNLTQWSKGLMYTLPGVWFINLWYFIPNERIHLKRMVSNIGISRSSFGLSGKICTQCRKYINNDDSYQDPFQASCLHNTNNHISIAISKENFINKNVILHCLHKTWYDCKIVVNLCY